jgi:hypothetical protein
MSFQIENDVAMPGRRNRYPFDTMLSGQSFQIEGEDEARKVRNAAYQYAKKVNEGQAKAHAEHTAAGGTDQAPAEVKFALRKVNEVDTGAHDSEGKAITVKVYRLWRE